MDPSASRTGTSKRLPSARSGKGSTSGEMPFLGSPASQVVPASLVSWVLVAREKPNWSIAEFITLSVS